MKLLETAGSAKLAIALVLVLILLSAAGALLPQEGAASSSEITSWRAAHPLPGHIGNALGLFHVFHSPLFLLTIGLIAVNTLSCTAASLITRNGFAGDWQQKAKTIGFVILHLSLLLVFAGGFVATGFSLDGYIVLTEGQQFRETQRGYLRLSEGPFRKEKHRNFGVTLKQCGAEYSPEWRPLQMRATLAPEVAGVSNEKSQLQVSINNPVTISGFSFTLDQTGFSPLIRFSRSGRQTFESYVALKTLQQGVRREYRDTVATPLPGKLIVTLYPDHEVDTDGVARKTGEEPQNPALLVEMLDDSGAKRFQKTIAMGESIAIGAYDLTFAGLRRWASFRVVDDPGYPVILLSLWLGIAGLVSRYLPDIVVWMVTDEKKEKESGHDHV